MAEGVSFDLGRRISFGRLRLDRGWGDGSGPLELKGITAAPLPESVGAR